MIHLQKRLSAVSAENGTANIKAFSVFLLS